MKWPELAETLFSKVALCAYPLLSTRWFLKYAVRFAIASPFIEYVCVII